MGKVDCCIGNQILTVLGNETSPFNPFITGYNCPLGTEDANQYACPAGTYNNVTGTTQCLTADHEQVGPYSR